MTTLRATINELASQFAAGVLNAIRGASLEEILAETNRGGAVGRGAGRPRMAAPEAEDGGAGRRGAGGAGAAGAAGRRRGRGGRLGRRSADDIAAIVDNIVNLLGEHPEGLRAEEIRQKLGLEAKELPRPIAEALSSKRISKQGQKRATTYFARGAGGGSKAGGSKASAGGGRRGGRAAKTGRGAAKAAKRGGAKRGARKTAAGGAANGTTTEASA